MELVREPGEELAAVAVHTHSSELGRGLQRELGGLPRRRPADAALGRRQDSKVVVVSGLGVVSFLPWSETSHYYRCRQLVLESSPGSVGMGSGQVVQTRVEMWHGA